MTSDGNIPQITPLFLFFVFFSISTKTRHSKLRTSGNLSVKSIICFDSVHVGSAFSTSSSVRSVAVDMGSSSQGRGFSGWDWNRSTSTLFHSLYVTGLNVRSEVTLSDQGSCCSDATLMGNIYTRTLDSITFKQKRCFFFFPNGVGSGSAPCPRLTRRLVMRDRSVFANKIARHTSAIS